MMNEKSATPKNRIPVRFVDEENDKDYHATATDGADEGEPTPGELGRASIYEDETEMQRRIDRGPESDDAGDKERADDRDTAGGPAQSELPERRDEQDTHRHASSATGSASATSPSSSSAKTSSATGGGASSALALQAELFAAQAELDIVEAELQKLKAEQQDQHEQTARRQADFDNYRKRVERERSETYNRVVADVVAQLFPVVDNLRRALDAESSVKATETQEFRNFLHGIELIDKQLNGVLDSLGVEPVKTVGQPFDPHVHEAIATGQTDEFEPDTVMLEIVRGYRLGDKLLRPAMVKVATK